MVDTSPFGLCQRAKAEELRNAEKYGYKFVVLKAYKFKSKIIFDEYVTDLYTMKQTSDPDSAMYIIAKLLLNSLYGRFGMKPEAEISAIIPKRELDTFNKDPDIEIREAVTLGSNVLIKYVNKGAGAKTLDNISVAIASAITAYSRILMVPFIIENADNICCIDTDGIKVTKPLDSTAIGPGLGAMKYEGEFTEAVFVAPKVYGGLYADGSMITKAKGMKNPVTY